MTGFDSFILTLFALALAAAIALGAALYYHFARFSPNRDVTTATLSLYTAGVIVIAFFVLLVMIFR